MNLPREMLLALPFALLAGCGGGGDTTAGGGGGSGGGGGGVVPNHTVTLSDTNENTARLANLNTFSDDSGGTALAMVTSHNALIIAAVRHAGWQALENSGLTHGEPSSNALFSDNNLGERIRKANGGTHLSSPGYAYYEDIASNSGSAAITLLWNTVYHRIPMMRHKAWRAGYGDKLLAAGDYPTAGVSAGNGFATLNWHEQTTPTISLSYWPGDGIVGVPKTFFSNSESPDPVADRDEVGCPIHLIFPEGSGTFTVVNATLVTGGTTHIPLKALVGNSSPSGAAGDVNALTADTTYLDPGELFLIPIPGSTGGLSANTSYTCTVSVTVNGSNYNGITFTYTTGP